MFKPIKQGENKIALKTGRGTYLRCSPNGSVSAKGSKITKYEIFTVVVDTNEACRKFGGKEGDFTCIGFYNEANKKWLSSDKFTDKITCDKEAKDTWEQWHFWDESKLGKTPGGDSKDQAPEAEGVTKKDKGYDSTIDLEVGRYGDMSVKYEDDFYKGRVDMPGSSTDIKWNYRRSGAATLVASAMTAANIAALYLF